MIKNKWISAILSIIITVAIMKGLMALLDPSFETSRHGRKLTAAVTLAQFWLAWVYMN